MNKKIYRSRTNRVIGRICGGIAEYLGIDPVVVRLIWVLAFFFGGFGLLAYIVCWVLIPEAPSDLQGQVGESRPSHDWGLGLIIGIAVVFLGVLLLLRNLFGWYFWDWSWKIGLPLLLVLIGILLLVRGKR